LFYFTLTHIHEHDLSQKPTRPSFFSSHVKIKYCSVYDVFIKPFVFQLSNKMMPPALGHPRPLQQNYYEAEFGVLGYLNLFMVLFLWYVQCTDTGYVLYILVNSGLAQPCYQLPYQKYKRKSFWLSLFFKGISSFRTLYLKVLQTNSVSVLSQLEFFMYICMRYSGFYLSKYHSSKNCLLLFHLLTFLFRDDKVKMFREFLAYHL